MHWKWWWILEETFQLLGRKYQDFCGEKQKTTNSGLADQDAAVGVADGKIWDSQKYKDSLRDLSLWP